MTESKQQPASGQMLDSKQLFHIILRRKWLLLICIIVFFLIGWFYTALRTPIYESNMLIQVSNNQGPAGGNSASGPSVIIFGRNSAAQSEAQIIPSRGVLTSAAKKLHLNVTAIPHTFPLFGHLIAKRYARQHPDEPPAQPWLGMDQYSWGNDRVVIGQFSVSKSLLAQPFTLKILSQHAYQLIGPSGKILSTSTTGQIVSLILGKKRFLTLVVNHIHARKGVQFTLTHHHDLVTAGRLAYNLKVKTELNAQNLLTLTYKNPAPESAARILSAIGNAAITNQIQGQVRQASEVLAFLHEQLPRVKKQLTAAEYKLNDYIKKNNGIDLPTESQNLMQNLSDLDQQIAKFKLQLAQLRTQYTDRSQQVKSMMFAVEQLQAQRDQMLKGLKRLPTAQQKQIDLMRNAKIQDSTYSALLQQIQEYQIMKAGTVGSLSVIDDADVPLSPVNMPAIQVKAFYAFVGFLLGLIYIFIEAYFILGMTSAEQIEERLGLSLVASILECKKQTQQEQTQHDHIQFIAEMDEHDLVAESFRSLFTYLQFELPTAKNNIIAIHGPTPNIGKSFISANLAYTIAQRDKRVLLIDGDIRKGRLADYFTQPNKNGLVDVLLDKVSLQKTIHTSRIPNLDILFSGHANRQFAELLTKGKMQAILEGVSKAYDYVIIDTAPILTISDAMLIAPFVGTNLLVLRHGKHDQHEIQLAVDRFRKAKILLNHFIFNRVAAGHGYYGRYAYYYQNYYREDKKTKGRRFRFWQRKASK